MSIMWTYYRDKYYSPRAALEHQFQGELAKDPRLQFAVHQIEAAEALINQIMEALDADSYED